MLTYDLGARGALPMYEYLAQRIREDVLSGVLPAWARYLSPIYTFDATVHPLPALSHAAASLLCVPPALWRFGRRDLA